jgi:endonuclease/exonuclease/phosphatase (EEP) superfamily protein YafD
MLWLALLASAAFAAFVWLMPGDLEDAGRLRRGLFWVAFMGRTYSVLLGAMVVALAAVALLLRRRAVAAGSMLLGCVLLGPWAASLVRPLPDRPDMPSFTVMSANLLVHVSAEAELLAEIRRTDPDIICFQEYTPAKAAVLVPALSALYPHQDQAMRDHAFGQAIFSKFPFIAPPDHAPHRALRDQLRDSLRVGGVVGIQDPQIRAVVDVRGTPVVIHNIHYPPPMSGSYLAEQRRMTEWLCASAREETRPLILAGDFNCTPESLNASDLRAAAFAEVGSVARGRSTTWPTEGLLAWIPVRIDHQWHSEHLACVHSEVCKPNGSDHRPIIAIYALKQPASVSTPSQTP